MTSAVGCNPLPESLSGLCRRLRYHKLNTHKVTKVGGGGGCHRIASLAARVVAQEQEKEEEVNREGGEGEGEGVGEGRSDGCRVHDEGGAGGD